MPAIHVFLSFQRFSEPSLQLNFLLDDVGFAEYGGPIPIRLRGVLQAKLDVNGIGARAHDSQSWSRASLEGSLRARYEA